MISQIILYRLPFLFSDDYGITPWTWIFHNKGLESRLYVLQIWTLWNLFDLHCNHWPFASVSCNVLIMDVVWSFCYIYKRQATDQREIEKIRVTVMRGREEDILHHWNVCRKVCKNIFRINVFVITFLSQGVHSWNVCLHVSI